MFKNRSARHQSVAGPFSSSHHPGSLHELPGNEQKNFQDWLFAVSASLDAIHTRLGNDWLLAPSRESDDPGGQYMCTTIPRQGKQRLGNVCVFQALKHSGATVRRRPGTSVSHDCDFSSCCRIHQSRTRDPRHRCHHHHRHHRNHRFRNLPGSPGCLSHSLWSHR